MINVAFVLIHCNMVYFLVSESLKMKCSIVICDLLKIQTNNIFEKIVFQKAVHSFSVV